MAYLRMFMEYKEAPEGIFAGIYDQFCEHHDEHVKQARVDGIVINYAVIPAGFRFKFRKNRNSGFDALAMNSWIAECESNGCIGVYESKSILIFDKNVGLDFIRPRVAFRYHLRGNTHDSLFRKPELIDLCRSELESVLARTDEECEQYKAWLVSGSKKPNPYASEILTYLFPSCIEVLDHDSIMSTRSVFNVLVEKMKKLECPAPPVKKTSF